MENDKVVDNMFKTMMDITAKSEAETFKLLKSVDDV
jgi:hypothetical protein